MIYGYCERLQQDKGFTLANILNKAPFASSTLSSENGFQGEENDQPIIGSLRLLDS